jgi:hypothetical protein
VQLLKKPRKGNYALGSISTRHFFANGTCFHLLLLAYNLINWFRLLCLPAEFQTATLQTPPQRILLTPARLRRARNGPTRALPATGYQEAAWKYALHPIQ